MCGITGFIDRKNSFDRRDALKRMTAALTHRGPDDDGAWIDEKAGVALGHRRLSIVDLSAGGKQPMRSSCGRYLVVFNGEIYNHRVLRRELEACSPGISWRGHSDTEVMLEAIVEWGVEGAVGRFIGMFAFALWDAQERRLHLVRDRVGEKPLYYGWMGGNLLFGSEMKALRAHPLFRGEIDRGALCLYLRHNCIPAPFSIYQGIYKLPPGCMVTFSWKELQRGALPLPVPYWRVRDAVECGVRNPFQGSEEEAIGELDSLLRDAIGQQMVADVPLGAFLSGGIDSSAIVSLMQAQSPRPIKTFTIGFDDQGYNEAQDAKKVALHLGTDHTELYVQPRDALAVIPNLPRLYDEPFADASQIPTYLVSQLTRRHVTVALSGDAGDELFAGYNRYLWGSGIWRRIGWIPRPARSLLASTLVAVPPPSWDQLVNGAGRVLPAKYRVRTPGDKLHKLAGVLDVRDPYELYYRLVSHWREPAAVVLDGSEPPTVLTDPGRVLPELDFTQSMMVLDLLTYLADDILVKVDRAAMGESLETRVPFLDHRVIEFAWRLPTSMKIRNGESKWILRQVLSRYVPRSLFERPKAGFGIPIDSWLRGPLREWAEELLSERRLKGDGFFTPSPIRQKWQEHLSGSRNWQYHLWDILMFQCWLGSQRP